MGGFLVSDIPGMTQSITPTEIQPTHTDQHSEEEQSILTEDVTRYVVVEINKNKYGLSTDATVELMDSMAIQITRVSHAPEYVQGVINHRGSIIPAIDTRALLGFETHEEGVKSLEELLAARESDHMKWLSELRECIDSGNTFTKATDPTKCAFGKWYDNLCGNESLLESLTRGDNGVRAIVEQFDEPHRKIHGIAKKVLRLAGEKETVQAKQIVDEAWDGELAQMRMLFKALIDAVKSIHTNMIVITELGAQKIGLMVDDVHSVFDCPDDSIEPLPESTENAEYLKGLVHQEDGTYILIADIERIYEKTCPN
jgi:purine-binding chemotaxis protein CheW